MVMGGMAAAAAVTAAAQALDGAAPILHRDVRSPRRGVPGTPSGEKRPPATSANAVIGDEPAAGRNPAAIGTGEKILPEPQPSEPPAPEEPVMGRSNFGADRETQLAPDANTGPDSRLAYVEAFNPSVVPFKRLTSLGAVRDDWSLAISDEHAQTDLRVGGKPTPGFDRFWGSVMLDLTPGIDLPLPSVSPGMRILSYEVEPRTDLIFSKDGADNFYVRSEEPDAKGLHRLVFLVEADPIYFAPRMPRTSTRVDEVARARGAPPLPRLPREVAESAGRVHELLRVKSRDPLGPSLNKLIAHFRAFAPKEIPDVTGRKLYETLVAEQAGVCRHRAYAFMITANALGIPTRFVANEAHAFTEVWVPEQGWIRVDLGGASNQLEVRNADGKSMYRPRGSDPFSRPEEYTNGGFSGYSTLRGDKVEGLTEEQKAEARTPRDGNGSGDGSGDGDGNGNGNGNDPGTVDPNFDPDDQKLDDQKLDDTGRITPGTDRQPAVPDEARKGKKATSIAVNAATPVGFRGEAIEVSGEVRGEGDKGLAGLPVDIWLAPAGLGGNRAVLVGHTVTDASGGYTAEVVVPYGLSLEPHEVYASTGGDREQQPAVSE
jgi:transglutaminase-like putative cysteine protease